MTSLDTIISFCKRRGFVYQTADIYGGINGIYDYGHLGVLMLKNIRAAWLEDITAHEHPVLEFEGSLLGPQNMWKASGHHENFHDPMIDCLNCKHRFRADEIDLEKACPQCGKKQWTDIRQFNMMFETKIGAWAENAPTAYLRPETAQSIFVNFKNFISTNRVKLPFGIAQIGKAFRNEINPKHFLFRVREFEQMELEWFCKPENADSYFSHWAEKRLQWYTAIGINPAHIRMRTHETHELAHYAQATSDIEYHFPFGWKELEGIAHRGNFDLKQHEAHSGKELSIYDEDSKQSYTPSVIETSVGAGRLFLSLIYDAYQEEKENDSRIVLKLSPKISPIKVAVFPLSKKLTDASLKLYHDIKKIGLSVIFDDRGSIGKRYRRQDEIGTPLCITYDFDSQTNDSVTVRFRDSMKQERVALHQLMSFITTHLKGV